MGKYQEFSDWLKEQVRLASEGKISLYGSDEEEAGAKWIAYGVIAFLKGRLVYSHIYPTDVVTWKRLSDSYRQFDVQIGYVGKNARKLTQSVKGRVTAFMQRVGTRRFSLQIKDWGSGYATYYTLQSIDSDGGYRFGDAIKPKPSDYYDDWEEVEA